MRSAAPKLPPVIKQELPEAASIKRDKITLSGPCRSGKKGRGATGKPGAKERRKKSVGRKTSRPVSPPLSLKELKENPRARRPWFQEGCRIFNCSAGGVTANVRGLGSDFSESLADLTSPRKWKMENGRKEKKERRKKRFLLLDLFLFFFPLSPPLFQKTKTKPKNRTCVEQRVVDGVRHHRQQLAAEPVCFTGLEGGGPLRGAARCSFVSRRRLRRRRIRIVSCVVASLLLSVCAAAAVFSIFGCRSSGEGWPRRGLSRRREPAG